MKAERTVREVRLEGSPYERGLARGRRLRGTLRVPGELALETGFVQGCYEAARAAFPPCEDEFEGMVEGGGFERERLKAYYFARLESALGWAPGCTMFAASSDHTAEGCGAIAGRNYDWATGDLRWCELRRIEPAEGPRRVGYTHHWAGCTDLLSERGLYVAIASLPPAEVRAPGVQWHVVVEMLAATCGNVEEAARACAGVNHVRPMSYLLADGAGRAAVVEATPNGIRLRRSRDGFVVAANHSLGGEVLREGAVGHPPGEPGEPVLPEPPNYTGGALERSRRRAARAEELLRARLPRFSADDARRVLTDHQAPICTGDHSRPDGGEWATMWSGVCLPAGGRFRIAPGLPCRHPFREFSLGEGPT